MTAATAAPASATDPLRAALSSGQRPARPGPLSTALAFAWRAVLRIKHVPDQLADVTVFPLMMLFMFTYLFGGALAGSVREYLQSVLPGLLVMTVIMSTQSTAVALNGDIGKGVFDRFRSLPIWQPAPLVGALLADLTRYAMAATVIVSVGVLLGFRPDAGLPGLLAGMGLVLLFAWCLSWVWTSLALLARTPESVMFLAILVTFPMSFVSNIFVDPATLPGWLEAFVAVNPVSQLVTAVRGLMHGQSAGTEIGWVFLTCAVLVAVFGPVTMRLYRRER
ncbi:ABC transporter permease [Nocardia otitidiscaviarum]|uniref:Transport permease protein n=1 Tax=Nocardia otitidiscaviarum TaxID=1823 RepID=A0A516NEP3_9NOCA|nr:ABC transporter permease [Nocardia otitidiscaviarum]MCP9622625.1 ABC transporter permease [Nocardia otitidiscaviarum]QDP77375.1 ABC transporter permease [Nocardia otitidiscaviarum]